MSAGGAMHGAGGLRPAWAALFVCALSLGATLAIALWAWRRRNAAPAAGPFAALALSQAVWNAGHLAELASGSLFAKVAWDSFQTLPAVAAPFFMLSFAARYTGRRVPVWLTVVIGAALADSHPGDPGRAAGGGLRASAHLEPPYGALLYDFTAWDLAYIAATLAVALTACGMLLGQLFQQRPPFRTQTTGVALALMISVVFGFGWVALDLRLQGERDITHVTFALSSLVLAWTLSRGRLFDLVPVAREAILEHLTDAVLVVDRVGRIVDANQVALTLLQAPARAAVGRPAAQVLAAWPALAALASGDEARQEEVASPGPDARWYDARWAPLRDRRGRSLGGTLVLRDVTTLRQARQVLEQRLQEAQKLEAVGRVAAGVAHDFNNLLTVISASVDVARRGTARRVEAVALMDEAQQAVDSAAGVTRQLLTFSRRQPNRPRRLSIAETVAAIEAVLRRLAHPSKLAAARPARTICGRSTWIRRSCSRC